MGTVIQTKFIDEEYDIDDGLVIPKSQLKDEDGTELGTDKVREAVKDALKDKRFNKQPKLCTNCVRVYYADEDEEKHHVDFPIYRKWTDNGETIRELAGESEWLDSDPTQVNSWFNTVVEERNKYIDGWGTQFRHLVQLLKRYCRSRKDWLDLLPNGMKLTMLVYECQPDYDSRLDFTFRKLIENLRNRLEESKSIFNLAHPDKPMLTRTENDANVIQLYEKAIDALEKINILDENDNNNQAKAREVWDWIFKSDGFFKEYDEATSILKMESSSVFDVPWKEHPPWEIRDHYTVSLTSKFGNSEHGSTWQEFQSNGPALKKHLYLRFHGVTNTPKPYRVFWQVVNTGSDAINAGSLRGEIIESGSVGAGGLHSTTAPGPLRREQTLYTGMHWVECFIVKNGVCVARSRPFIVNIQ